MAEASADVLGDFHLPPCFSDSEVLAVIFDSLTERVLEAHAISSR